MNGRCWTAAVTLLAALVLFGRSAWGGHFVADGSIMRDTYHVSTILETYGGHVARGHLPLWLPEFASGAPAPAAWIYGLLSPGILLWAVLPASTAWSWSAILHLILLATGLHAYLRARGVSATAAAAGALLAAFSGYTLGRTVGGHLNLVWPLAWTPWILLGIQRVADGAPRAVPGLALASALGLVSGHVQAWFFLGPACALVAVATLTERPPGDTQARGLPGWGRLAAAVGLALLLSAFQWLPTAQYASVAERAPIDESFLVAWSTAPSTLAEHVAPGLLGTRPETRWAPGDYENESAMAGGLALLFLAAAGAAAGRRRWTVLAVGGAIVAFGQHVTLVRALHDIPPLEWARVSGRALVLPSLALPVLAAYGIDELLSNDASRRGRAWWRAGAVTVLVGGGAVAALRAWSGGLDWPRAAGGRAWTFAEAWGATATPALLRSAAGLAVVAVCVGVGRRVPWLRCAVPLAALVAALLVAPRVASIPDAFYRASGAQAVPVERRGHRVLLRDMRVPFPERDGVATLRPLSHVGTRWMHALADDMQPPLARWFAVAGGMAAPGLPPGPPLDLAERVRFSAVPGPLPERARIYGAAGASADTAALTGMLTGRDALWLAEGAGAEEGRSGGGPPGERMPGAQASIQVSDDPCEVVVQVEAPHDGWLLVTESYFPGWATTEGEPVTRANVNFRAVPVAGGRSRVVLRYRSLPFLVGAAGALLGLLVVVGLVLRRRTGDPGREPA